MDWTQIIITAITICVPAGVTIFTSGKQKKLSKMNAAKSSILQMQMEDVISVELLEKLPYNYTNIHYEYDQYHQNGGNSDIDKKMAEYEEWYEKVTKKALKK